MIRVSVVTKLTCFNAFRRQYEQYVCKRIPGKQAVVVMACDNTHISDDMILEPGLVMIFAHGIE